MTIQEDNAALEREIRKLRAEVQRQRVLQLGTFLLSAAVGYVVGGLLVYIL